MIWPRLKLRNELIGHGGFLCDRDNPFARFGGGGSDVEQAPTHTQPWGQLEQALAGLVVPGIGGMDLTQPEYYGGDRLAEMSPEAIGYGWDALRNLSGGISAPTFSAPIISGNMQDIYGPIYEQANQQWNQEFAPGVMERFAGMGSAMSGGAASALAREGENLTTDAFAAIAPLFQQTLMANQEAQLQTGLANQSTELEALLANQQAQMGLPGLAQSFGTFEQAARQAPLDTAYQQWYEKQPYGSPYVALGKDIMSGGGANAMESYAEPGTDWGAVGGNLAGNAMIAAALKSDRRLKQNFAGIYDALEKLKELRGQTFNFKDAPDVRRAGLIAQDVQKVLPEAVEEKSGVLYIRLDGIVGLLVNAVNELADQVAALN